MGILNPLPMAAKLGALRTLSKPFSGKELVDLVEEILPRP